MATEHIRGLSFAFCADPACNRREAAHLFGICTMAHRHVGQAHKSFLCNRDKHELCVGAGCECPCHRRAA